MESFKLLKNEIAQLKEQSQKVNQQIEQLQKNQNFLNEKLIGIKKEAVIENRVENIETSKPEEREEPKSVGGIFLIIFGCLLSLTIVGAIIGIPLLIWGVVLVSRKSEGKSLKIEEENKKTNKPVVKTAEIKKTIQTQTTPDSQSFEENLGIKWFTRIGILALVLGIGFFIKYTIDMGWISHLMRISMGIIFGISLVISGQFLSKKEKYSNWAKTLVGGGFAITYFVVFAAYHFQEYRMAIGMSQTLDIFLLSLVVLTAILFSLKDNSRIIAAESFFLGYLVALLNNNFEVMTIVYTLILTLGLVIVVSYKKWSLIGLGGIMASYFMYLLWLNDNPDSFMYSGLILVSYFMAFTVQSIFLTEKKEIFGKNVSMILINSGLFFLLYYSQIEKYYPDFAGFFIFILAIFNFIGLYIFKILGERKYSFVYLCLALFCVTLFIPIQFNPELVTIVWSLEALVLLAMFLKLRIDVLKNSSFIIAFIVAFRTFFIDTSALAKLDLNHLFSSTRLFSFLATILCFYVMSKIIKNRKEIFEEGELRIASIYLWLASGFLVLIIFLELADDYSFLVTVLLSFLTLLYLSISKLSNKEFYQQALVFSMILFSKVLFYDAWNFNDFSLINLFSSSRFFAFIIVTVVFYGVSWNLKNNSELLDKSVMFVSNIYSYLGTFLIFLLILIEMEGFWISATWSILALSLMMIGLFLGNRQLRLQGIIIFLITILRVFLYDSSSLDTIYRTFSYIVLGSILLSVSFLYTKYKEKLKEIL